MLAMIQVQPRTLHFSCSYNCSCLLTGLAAAIRHLCVLKISGVIRLLSGTFLFVCVSCGSSGLLPLLLLLLQHQGCTLDLRQRQSCLSALLVLP